MLFVVADIFILSCAVSCDCGPVDWRETTSLDPPLDNLLVFHQSEIPRVSGSRCASVGRGRSASIDHRCIVSVDEECPTAAAAPLAPSCTMEQPGSVCGNASASLHCSGKMPDSACASAASPSSGLCTDKVANKVNSDNVHSSSDMPTNSARQDGVVAAECNGSLPHGYCNNSLDSNKNVVLQPQNAEEGQANSNDTNAAADVATQEVAMPPAALPPGEVAAAAPLANGEMEHVPPPTPTNEAEKQSLIELLARTLSNM